MRLPGFVIPGKVFRTEVHSTNFLGGVFVAFPLFDGESRYSFNSHFQGVIKAYVP